MKEVNKLKLARIATNIEMVSNMDNHIINGESLVVMAPEGLKNWADQITDIIEDELNQNQ